MDKQIILLDEPFSALDAITRFELQAVFVEWLAEKTVIMVTHDPVEALRVSDQVWVMVGQPAYIVEQIELKSPRPRALDHADIRRNEMRIMKALATEVRS